MMRRLLRPFAALALALGIVIPLAYAADTTTPNLLLTNQEAGSNLNTWGDIADANYERIDNKLGDTTTVSTTGGTTELTSTQEIVQVIEVSGTLASDATIEFSCRGGYWVISNETSGDFSVTANCDGTTGTVITQGTKLGVYSDGSDIKAVGASGTKAVGEIFDYAGTSCPAQSIQPYGQAISRTTFSALFGVLGTTYGAGDLSTTFNVPDLRGRVIAGEDDMGGTSANRLTGFSGSPNGDTLGAADGAETLTVAKANLPNVNFSHSLTAENHNHSASDSLSVTTSIDNGASVRRGGNTVNVREGGGSFVNNLVASMASDTLSLGSSAVSGSISIGNSGTLAVSGTVSSGGSGTALSKVQPTIILNKCLYTGV